MDLEPARPKCASYLSYEQYLGMITLDAAILAQPVLDGREVGRSSNLDIYEQGIRSR
jgi:hypothetical protein